MKTTKEMIDVMQAYLDGEQIEESIDQKVWFTCEPIWNWAKCDYRVKKKVYVPFDTAEEFFAAQRKHGGGLICIEDGRFFGGYDVSITLNGHIFIHERKKSGEVISFFGNLLDLLEYFKMADGTPCGKEIETCKH